MRKTFFLTVVITIFSFSILGLVEAERMPPKNVRPMIYKGIKFIAPGMGKMGYVEARDTETNKKVWEKKVYNVIINPMLEEDVQWIFISSLSIEDGKLVVVNERGRKYNIDIPKNILEVTENDAYYYLQPWDSNAPYPYENNVDYRLVSDSYQEKWIESSVEKYTEAVRKAKEVLKEWGQNPDKYEYNGKSYDYRISVSESPNFISVIFYPIGLGHFVTPNGAVDIEMERHVEIRMTKKDFVVLSILPGV